ncbi:hypothetical protein [Oceanithermus sp.]|uniref:hypothetical protein n=1 Tax=Oceanithermus sp. TaxID=2268145 RepID=UPI00257F6ED0|nr:hypothetical protein [Oceanithermus sp.]
MIRCILTYIASIFFESAIQGLMGDLGRFSKLEVVQTDQLYKASIYRRDGSVTVALGTTRDQAISKLAKELRRTSCSA